MKEAQEVKHNKLNASTRQQYLSANTAFVVFLFEHFPTLLLPEFLQLYQSLHGPANGKIFVKGVKDSLKTKTICPFKIDSIDADLFLTYLLS